MKMVKRMLLGSAAGLAAVAGARAADLPLKAAPVEYVKICSLYGEGFFYIPGTDACLKIGGWVRFETQFNNNANNNPFANSLNTRSQSSDFATQTRAVVSFDTRSQTEYGTLRAYYRGGFELTSGAPGTQADGSYYTERAFIQLGGFTFGKSISFFDIFFNQWSLGSAGYAAAGSNTASYFGTNLAAYTAQFGNGLSATLSVEDNTVRRNALWDAASVNNLAIGNYPGPQSSTPLGYYGNCATAIGPTDTATAAAVGCNVGDYAAQQFPDIVANIRVDQAWGTAQVGAALHQVRGDFYGANTGNAPTYTGVAPANAWGWAVNGGIQLNLPWTPGDKVWVEGTYDVGASAYTGFGWMEGYNGPMARFSGSNVATGWALDGVFGTQAQGGIALSTAWDVTAALEHYWTPALRSSVWGSYTMWQPGSTGNSIMCGSATNGLVVAATGKTLATSGNAAAQAACNFAFDTWQVGTRTIWNPVKNLDLGLEVAYQQIDTKMGNLVGYNFLGSGTRAAGIYTPANEGNFTGMFRIQRNFYP